MTVANFIKRMLNKNKFTFYINDKIIDVDLLYDDKRMISAFDFEDNCVRLYVCQ